MKVFKLSEEQFSRLREAGRVIEAIDDALEIVLTHLVEKKAKENQQFWENVEQIAGIKCTDGKNLRINWVSGTITCDNVQETDDCLVEEEGT